MDLEVLGGGVQLLAVGDGYLSSIIFIKWFDLNHSMLSQILLLWYLGQTLKSFQAGPDHDRLHPLLRIDLLKRLFIFRTLLLIELVLIDIFIVPFLLQLRCCPYIIQHSLISRFEHLFGQICIENSHILLS